MEMLDKLTSEVKRFALENGARLVGVADAEELKKVSGDKDPFRLLEDAKAIVVFAYPLVEAMIAKAPDEQYNRLVELHYQIVREIAYKIALFIEEKGFRAYPCHDQGDIEHKRAAELAGLGRVGEHTLLITPQYECRVHLNSVVTNAPLRIDERLDTELCDDCGECIRNCPAKAIEGGKKINVSACRNYRKNVLGRRYCGICMKVCWTHFKNLTTSGRLIP